MFRVTITLLTGLVLFAAETSATGSYACEKCSTPYTANGQQTFANFAHNLAWGVSPVRITNNGYGSRIDSSFNAGSWDLRITNLRGETVTVRYRPSIYQVITKAFGVGHDSIDTFTLVLPNGRTERVRVVYRPGQDYEIYDPDRTTNWGAIDAYLLAAEAYYNSEQYLTFLSFRDGWRTLELYFQTQVHTPNTPIITEEEFPPGEPVPPLDFDIGHIGL